MSASGTGTTQAIATFIADTGDFWHVCVGTYKDSDLTITPRYLRSSISNITSSSAEFKTAQPLTFPLVVQGALRFTCQSGSSQPVWVGQRTPTSPLPATLRANNTKVVAVTGHAESGDIRVTGSQTLGTSVPARLLRKRFRSVTSGRAIYT